MQQHPVIAFAASLPPHATSKALATLRNEHTSAAALRLALAGVDAEVSAGEARVDGLEAERRRLLATSANDGVIDQIDESLKAATRTWERISAAKEEIPARLAAREALERSLGRSAAQASELQQRGIAILLEAHPLALAKLLDDFWNGAGELERTNEELVRAGMPTIDWPLQALATHIGCDLSELPQVGDWQLPGYYPHPPVPAERQLSRVKELLTKGRKR